MKHKNISFTIATLMLVFLNLPTLLAQSANIDEIREVYYQTSSMIENQELLVHEFFHGSGPTLDGQIDHLNSSL